VELSFWEPSWELLLGMLLVEGILGDRGGAFHPVVLMGKSLRWLEIRLESVGMWNRWGGSLLAVFLLAFWTGMTSLFFEVSQLGSEWLAYSFLAVLGGWFIACRSLLEHTLTISPGCDGNLSDMRNAIAMIVGRDTSMMDEDGCRRAGVESLAESLVDGILTPLFFFALWGVGGIVIFKVISTMDSMVGYRSERYEKFGWAGARLDDVFNWVPARLSWLLISAVAFLDPRFHGWKALVIGWRDQHHLPGFNSGWPEATAAGALDRRLVGPIWRNGELETELWIGHQDSPPCGSPLDLSRARHLTLEVSVFSTLILFIWLR